MVENCRKIEIGWLLHVAGFTAIFIEANYLTRDWANDIFYQGTCYVMLQRLAVYITLERTKQHRMSLNLAPAYKLIYAFKSGHVRAGTRPTAAQQRLVHLLCQDLALPEVESFEERVLMAAQADSAWNARAQSLVGDYYALLESGHLSKAKAARAKFIASCPSSWYRAVAEALV